MAQQRERDNKLTDGIQRRGKGKKKRLGKLNTHNKAALVGRLKHCNYCGPYEVLNGV